MGRGPNQFETVARSLGGEPLLLKQSVYYNMPIQLVAKLLRAQHARSAWSRYNAAINTAVEGAIPGAYVGNVSVVEDHPLGANGSQYVYVLFKDPRTVTTLPRKIPHGIGVYRGELPPLTAGRMEVIVGTNEREDFADLFVHPDNRSANLNEDYLHSTPKARVLAMLDRAGIRHIKWAAA